MNRPEEAASFERKINYYETDVMGVVHHSHYLKFFEEARVAWIDDQGIGQHHFPHVDVHWAVLETRVRHLKPAYFPEVIKTYIQVRREGLKLAFQYATYSSKHELIALAETVLAPVNSEKKPVKLPAEVKQVFERNKWTETWL
ncbi:MAG: acyl-CoA thioesterase [Bdellovibrionales bacterium]|nr:acyl-CoA thioesterase [Bdellovibrionales bacterium]